MEEIAQGAKDDSEVTLQEVEEGEWEYCVWERKAISKAVTTATTKVFLRGN